jgi:hypothetical protein
MDKVYMISKIEVDSASEFMKNFTPFKDEAEAKDYFKHLVQVCMDDLKERYELENDSYTDFEEVAEEEGHEVIITETYFDFVGCGGEHEFELELQTLDIL